MRKKSERERKGRGKREVDHIFFWRVKERRWMNSPYYSNSWVVKGKFQSYTSKTFSSGLCCVSSFLHEKPLFKHKFQRFQIVSEGADMTQLTARICGECLSQTFCLARHLWKEPTDWIQLQSFDKDNMLPSFFVLLKMLVKVWLSEHLQI